MSDTELSLTLVPASDESGYDEEFLELQKISSDYINGRPLSLSQLCANKLGLGLSLMQMSPPVIAALAGSLGTFLGAWVTSRNGRKIRIKVGDVEVEASSAEEVERLLERAKELRADDNRKKLL